MTRRQFSPSVFDHHSWILRKRLTTKSSSPIGLYYVNCTRFGQLILRKIIKNNWCHRMSHFKAEMHQIRFRRWGSFQRSPHALSECLLLRRGEESEGKNGEEKRWGEGREEKRWEMEERRGDGRGRDWEPKWFTKMTPLFKTQLFAVQ